MTERQLKRIINEEINNVLGEQRIQDGKIADIKSKRLKNNNGKYDESAKNIFDTEMSKLYSEIKKISPVYEEAMLALINVGFTESDFNKKEKDLTDIKDVTFENVRVVLKKNAIDIWVYKDKKLIGRTNDPQDVVISMYSNSANIYLSCWDDWIMKFPEYWKRNTTPPSSVLTVLAWDWNKKKSFIASDDMYDYLRECVVWHDDVEVELKNFFSDVKKILPYLKKGLENLVVELS